MATKPKIKSFEEARQRDGTLNRLPPRLLPVEIRRIVGSVSAPKVAELTADFLGRHGGENAPRYRSVHDAMQADVPLPPIELYALRGKYYVVDGHHRVAAARALGYLYLDALVHEFLLPATSDANRLHNERLHFERLTGLGDIVLTATGQYRKLLNQMREHQFFLGANGQATTLKLAAADWRDYVYGPIVERLATGAAPTHFPGRTLADLYVYLCDYKWVRSQNKGMDIGFPKALADFERLYPAPSATASAMAAPLHALRALARPVINAGHGAWERHAATHGAEQAGPIGGVSARKTAPCPICGAPMEQEDGTACAHCRHEIAAGTA